MNKINFTTNYIIEQIKTKIDILTVVEESGLQLQKRGRNYLGLCPFHSEKTPSFSVNPHKNIFKCFGCEVGGDQITLYAALNHVSNGQAISRLGKRLGLSNSKPLPKPIERQYAQKKKDKQLEERFLQSYKQVFDDLLFIQNMMNDLAQQYEFVELLVDDALLVQYYHEKAYHEHLLDSLLAGILNEIDFEQQVLYYKKAREVVERWQMLLEKHMLIFSENMA
ncbi:CHC2 zinc finger domain-containing protein [Peribacillus loiseleuriae]|uniref:CHC2 zinc finger domain-containing protein n=1 Tax=Peribacillus loiseleuriae TaxID=1679170 RepID=UPI00382294E9